MNKRIIVFAVIAVLFLYTACSEFNAPAKAEPSPTSTAAPTATALALPTPLPPPTAQAPAPAFSPTATIALVPGLMPSDVTVNLEQRRLTCGEIEQGEMYFTHTCKKDDPAYSLMVVVYGRGITSVDFITATILQYTSPPDPALSASFLGFVATMPYTGSAPQEARTWVESNVQNGSFTETDFSGVHYALRGTPSTATLEIGYLP